MYRDGKYRRRNATELRNWMERAEGPIQGVIFLTGAL
jgi:hypothetical protein